MRYFFHYSLLISLLTEINTNNKILDKYYDNKYLVPDPKNNSLTAKLLN